MNFLIRKFKNIIQNFVDRANGKPIDIAGITLYALASSMALKVLIDIVQLIHEPIVEKTIHSSIYAILIMIPLFTFYLTLMGDKLRKTSTRLSQFIIVVLTTSIFATGYISQLANTTFINWLNGINNIEIIPYEMLVGNIRVVTFFFPFILVFPITIMTFKLVVDKDIRVDLTEYEVELLLPNIMKRSNVTIDLKICEDSQTGEERVVPEKKLYEHIWLQGGTGSGKTATVIRPLLGQLFGKKGYFTQKLKELSYEALQEGIATLTLPVSNYYFNENFSMDLIKPADGKLEEYKKKFGDFIIGIRDKEEVVLEKTINGGQLELQKLKSDSQYLVEIQIERSGIPVAAKNIKIISSDGNKIENISEKFEPIKFILKSSIEMKKDTEDKKAVEKILQNDITEEIEDKYLVVLPKLEKGYYYKIIVKEKGSGKIIYRNLGVTVIAPDGGLPKDTIEIGQDHGVKVNKIDPTMSEIKKGKVARFNPLLGDRPDKVGDIISSILSSMEQSDGAGSKAYFVNASVRAVRNVVILLKLMYPKMEKRNPNLNDVRKMLSDFNAVVPYVEAMKRDPKLKSRWESVITYFETSFYPPEVDDRGKVIPGSKFGSQRKKTEEAIGGIINQLDNFLTREEIQYILCPENDEDSLNLADVLENGECIAIATRQNDLGQKLGKAFALFFILSLQNEVLSRFSEDENPEIPHFLIIDEFPFYVNDNTKIFFTFARKYKCSVLIAIQNMGQLKQVSDEFGETIFTNTDTKILLPKANVEDCKYWSEFFGTQEKFELQTGINTSSMWSDNPSYKESIKGTVKNVKNITEQNIKNLNFKETFYSYTNFKGRTKIGKGNTDFLHNQKIPKTEIKTFDFEKYNPYPFEDYIKEIEEKKKLNTKSKATQDHVNTKENDFVFAENLSTDTKDNVKQYETKSATKDTEKEDIDFKVEGENDIFNYNNLENLTFDEGIEQNNNENNTIKKAQEKEMINKDINFENKKDIDNINTSYIHFDTENLTIENSNVETTKEKKYNKNTNFFTPKKQENKNSNNEFNKEIKELSSEDIKENKKIQQTKYEELNTEKISEVNAVNINEIDVNSLEFEVESSQGGLKEEFLEDKNDIKADEVALTEEKEEIFNLDNINVENQDFFSVDELVIDETNLYLEGDDK